MFISSGPYNQCHAYWLVYHIQNTWLIVAFCFHKLNAHTQWCLFPKTIPKSSPGHFESRQYCDCNPLNASLTRKASFGFIKSETGKRRSLVLSCKLVSIKKPGKKFYKMLSISERITMFQCRLEICSPPQAHSPWKRQEEVTPSITPWSPIWWHRVLHV